jgi:Pro-kumamolisin, activation domain/Putative Ig domain
MRVGKFSLSGIVLMHVRRTFAATAIVLAAVVCLIPAAAGAAQRRVVVAGTEAPRQNGNARTGDLAPSSRISFAVTLPLRDRAGLDALIAAVSDPRSPQHGHYLTPAQFAARFSPTEAQVKTVSDYLSSQGLAVVRVSPNRTAIDASGTAAQIRHAFGTKVGRYHDPQLRRNYFANDAPVSLPASVAPDVLAVIGLDNHFVRRHPPIPAAVGPFAGSGPAGGYTPAELTGAYDFGPLASGGFNGSGQTVGLFELDGFQQSNISTYDNSYGLGSPPPTVVPVDGGSGRLGNGQVEVELDIEAIHAVAPQAHITVWEAPNTDSGVIDAYNAMAASNTTPTNSTSWGLCEPDSSSSTITSEDNIFAQMAAQGMTLFAASGDSGAYDCGVYGSLAVDNPADDPNVTGAGGTSLQISGTSYSSERAWDTSATEGGGGGVSTIFSKPSWQSAPGVPSNCSSKRCVPDISLNADPATGYSIFTQGSWTVVGGTSAAAPMWAGFAAVYNQDAVANGHARLGFANPTLYNLASTAQSFPPFHDITAGHTSSSTRWPATAGYDLATGLGSYDANNIARDLMGGTTVTPDFSISASPNSVSLVQGASGTSSISTALTAGSAGTVNLTASGAPAGTSTTLSPTAVTAGGSSTLTLSTASSTATGTYTITVTGTEGSKTHSTAVTLTVTSSGGGSGIVNGGFETGNLSGWTASGASATVVNSNCHSGTYCAQLGSTSPTNGDSSIAQTFTVPQGSNTLSFWYRITCPDTIQYDWATATLKDNTAGTTTTPLPKTCSNSGTWVQAKSSVIAGHSYTLTLTSHDDNYAGDPTYTLYDDVSLSSVANTVTVTNPGNQTSTVGQAVSLPIQATDSASGQTLTYSATGLPAGLSINPSSGVISGAPSGTGTSSVTVKATDTTGASGSTSFSWAVNPAGSGPVVTNGGFETGTLAGWTTSGARERISTTAHSGSYSAWLGDSSPTNGDSTMSQTVTVPATATTLTFWYANNCPDSVTYDWATMQIRSTGGSVLATPLAPTCASSYAWTQATYDVTSLRGQTVVLWFASHDDSYPGDPTYTLYDDVSIT